MNYAESRAYEIKRMDYEQQIALRVHENNAKRAFYPHEIQERFLLAPLKATYMIPEIDTAQAGHAQRIKSEFYKAGIYPKYEHLSPLDLEEVRAFDELINEKNLDLVYSGGSKRRNFREEVTE